MTTPTIIRTNDELAALDGDTLLEVHYINNTDYGLIYTAQELLTTNPSVDYYAAVLAGGEYVRAINTCIAKERIQGRIGSTDIISVHTLEELEALDPDTIVQPYDPNLDLGSITAFLWLVTTCISKGIHPTDKHCSAAILVDGETVRAARKAVADAQQNSHRQ